MEEVHFIEAHWSNPNGLSWIRDHLAATSWCFCDRHDYQTTERKIHYFPSENYMYNEVQLFNPCRSRNARNLCYENVGTRDSPYTLSMRRSQTFKSLIVDGVKQRIWTPEVLPIHQCECREMISNERKISSDIENCILSTAFTHLTKKIVMAKTRQERVSYSVCRCTLLSLMRRNESLRVTTRRPLTKSGEECLSMHSLYNLMRLT